MRQRLTLLLLSLLLAAPAWAQQPGRLDVTTFVVLGEGLSAGMAEFALKDTYQQKSFPAQIAKQIVTAFPQPLMQQPGLGNAPGFAALPPLVPGRLQTTLRHGFPPGLFIFNLSVPNFKVADAINRRPSRPLVHPTDAQQTLTNMIIGYPALLLGKEIPLWTQVEYAEQMRPTMVMVALGYFDVLDAAVKGNPSLLPDVAGFRSNYQTVLSRMSATLADVIVVNIPNPLDTAYFSTLDMATRVVGAPASTLAQLYGLQNDDLLTIPGLTEIGNQLTARSLRPLPPGSVLSRAAADQIRARVAALNTEIAAVAQANGAVVYDLNALFARVRASGVIVGERTLTADFLGGFYSLNGAYPGMTGHAVIANEILALLNQRFGASFQAVNAVAVLGEDPAARANPFRGRLYTAEELERLLLWEMRPPRMSRSEQ